MLNGLYSECLQYALLFHSEDDMYLLLQNTLQWDVDSITLERIAALSEYYALPPILQFNSLILSSAQFALLPKTSFASFLFSLFVFLTTSSDAVHNPCVPTLLKEANSLKQTIANPTELYRIVRSSLLFWFLFLQLASPSSISFQSDWNGNREMEWDETNSESNWLFVIKVAMSLSATAVMHAVDPLTGVCSIDAAARFRPHREGIGDLASLDQPTLLPSAVHRKERVWLCLLVVVSAVCNGLRWKRSLQSS